MKKIKAPSNNITDAEFAIIGLIAFANDFCDWFGLDLLFFRMIDTVTAFILGFWCYFRLHKFPTGKFGGTFLIELIPIVGDISPTWTIFVVSMYFEQNK
ncbi:hypothetical protein KJ756_01115 [Patescibacteria group bacterium]|nr:hypothetical protein [Patescibacteria group bacterium]MBU4082909.1 hypothetical protein [Patescibacteria group bacterium]MCG2809179.1 hypothetical protein [Candidatus Portnoybacteria bacterium]